MMGRAPCCDKANVKKGPWSPEEDAKLKDYIQNHQGTTSVGNWIALPQKAGLKRCGKSCRLRWLNYLRPNIKHGEFSDDEDRLICTLFANIGSRWSIIAAQLPGRTDNDIKNYWNTKLKKKLIMGMSLNQKNPHQTTTFPLPSTHNFLSQNHSMNSPCTTTPLLSQIPSPYEAGNTNNYYSTLISPNSVLQTHDTRVGSSMHDSYYNQVRDGSSNNINNLIMFGGGERSSGSSEGSQIISRCKVEQDHSDNYHVDMSYFNNENHQNKFIMGYAEHHEEKAAADNNDCFISKSQMDNYSTIEEIKQLISTTTFCSNNLNFFVDEIKAQGKNQI